MGNRWRNLPDTQVVPTELQTELCGVRLSLMNWRENTWAGPLPTSRSGDSSYWSACCKMQPQEVERTSKVLPQITGRGSWRDGPWTPPIKTLIGATDEAILQAAEQVYWGEWTLGACMLSHWQQDDCMRELWQESNRCMSKADLQCVPGSAEPSRSRRHSHGCSTSWTHSPSAEPQGREVA